MLKELENYMYLCEKIENEDMQKRVRYSFAYYIKNANLYKYLGMALSIMGIVLPALATVLTVCKAGSGFIAAVTAASTAASGVLAYLKCADKQETYRRAAENMKAELIAYAAGQGEYKAGKDTEEPVDKDGIFFDRIEKIIQNGYKKIVELDRGRKN